MIEEQIEKLRRRGYMWISRDDLKKFKKIRPQEEFKIFVPEKLFPPCIKNISAGLPDGRKRSLFVLINFLRSSNWNWDDIEKYIFEWNQKNKPPLRENLIRSHIRWSRNRNESIPPPNCFKDDGKEEGYYKDFDVCKPDNRCKTIKNPVTYARSMIKRGKIRKLPPKRKASSKQTTE
jgi:DNA primase large subunit